MRQKHAPFLAIDLIAIAVLIGMGLWLQSINGKDGIVDEFFAPFPLGVTGAIAAVLFEKAWA
jgi:hypothetical protein